MIILTEEARESWFDSTLTSYCQYNTYNIEPCDREI